MQDFPSALPELSSEQLSMLPNKYGIWSAVKSTTFHVVAEYSCFSKYCSNPLQLSRPFGMQSITSITNILSTISLYLGFIHHVLQVPLHLLTLRDCADPHKLAMFYGMLVARSQSEGTMHTHFLALHKVVQWMEASSVQQQEKSRLASIIRWMLANLRKLFKVVGVRSPQRFDPDKAPTLPELISHQVCMC